MEQSYKICSWIAVLNLELVLTCTIPSNINVYIIKLVRIVVLSFTKSISNKVTKISNYPTTNKRIGMYLPKYKRYLRGSVPVPRFLTADRSDASQVMDGERVVSARTVHEPRDDFVMQHQSIRVCSVYPPLSA